MVPTNTPTNQEPSTATQRTTTPDRGPISSTRVEHKALSRIAHALEAVHGGAVKLAIGDEPTLDVPPSLLRVLRRGADTLAQDYAVMMGQLGKLLTIGQAADLLMESSSYVVQLLDSGELPSVVVDEARRVPLNRLLEYQALIARQRRAALQHLTRLSEEMGLYDLENEERLNTFPESDEEVEKKLDRNPRDRAGSV